MVIYILYIYLASFVKPERALEIAKFRLSSWPQTGICWPPVSGPRSSFLARSRLPTAYLRARSLEVARRRRAGFRRISGRRRDVKGSTFFLFARGDFVSSCCSCCCDQASIYLFDRSVSRSTAFSIDNLPAPIAFGRFDPLCLTCFCTLLPGRVPGPRGFDDLTFSVRIVYVGDV